MTKKLYVVSVEYQAYVLAHDEKEAESHAKAISLNEEPAIFSMEVGEDPKNPLNWPTHACIYHSDQFVKDVSLWEIIGV